MTEQQFPIWRRCLANETGSPSNCLYLTEPEVHKVIYVKGEGRIVFINNHHHPHWTMPWNGKKNLVLIVSLELQKECNTVKG